ncbi:MAG: hypothetical protein Q7S10_02510 [bacterium]|nr:hypothetical protein [bacterium]
MAAQNPLEVARVVRNLKGTPEQGFLVGDSIAALQWIIATKGNARRIDDLPGCFSAKLWAHNNHLFTAEKVSHNVFRFYLTIEGARFLNECRIKVDVETEIRPFEHQCSGEPTEVTRVFVQDRNQVIVEVNLATVPEDVLEQLRMGMLCVHEGKLYGTSPEAILGTD